MEITSKFKEREHLHHHHHHHHHLLHHHSSPLNSPNTNNNGNNTLPITRSDPNSPYPTTFVTADTSSFKQVVQMLTGSSDTTPKTNTSKLIQSSPSPRTSNNNSNSSSNNNNNNIAEAACSSQQAASARNYIIPPIKTTQPKKQGFKLYERRNSIKHLISPLNAATTTTTLMAAQTSSFSFSPRHKQEILSPSLLDFPSLTLSPVTPLVEDPFDKSSPSVANRTCCGPTAAAAAAAATSSSSLEEEEDKAIAEKGFYMHPSPISTPRDSEPQLLPLFPLESPRVSET